MKREQFIARYVKFKLVVQCKTKELSDEFLKFADEFGFRWRSGHSYLDLDYYDEFQDATCYYVLKGEYDHEQWYQTNGFEILEYKGERK